jgi:hypothetical protein
MEHVVFVVLGVVGKDALQTIKIPLDDGLNFLCEVPVLPNLTLPSCFWK